MKHHGTAEWNGGLQDGKGNLSTESGALHHNPYSFKTRFEGDKGTNPEELIAAAHAGCFSMAFAAQLEKEGYKAESIKTKVAVSLEKGAEGFSITTSHLDVTAKIPRIDEHKFQEIATQAKKGCPVSKLLHAEITMDAVLEK